MIAVTVALAFGAAGSAYADPIPGATYNGVAADGATVQLTVSSDGTIVDSYRVTDAQTATCQFYGSGQTGAWPGAPIVNNTFQYQLYSAILFQGTFPGSRSASGTFRFQDPAQGGNPGCGTGTVSWTATTTATPAGSASSGGGGGGQSGRKGKRPFVTRVALRKLSKAKLGGQLKSTNARCVVGRTVILWRGRRRIGSTKSKAHGRYTFTRPALWRGHGVRASAATRRLPRNAGTCAAGSSPFISA